MHCSHTLKKIFELNYTSALTTIARGAREKLQDTDSAGKTPRRSEKSEHGFLKISQIKMSAQQRGFVYELNCLSGVREMFTD